MKHRTFVTGDCHIPNSIDKIKPHIWKEQEQLTKKDHLIICGDSGLIFNHYKTGQTVSSNTKDDRWIREELFWLNWFGEECKFTTLFVDGNHENFDRLKTYPVTENWNGGRVRKISESFIHLMRGEIYELNGSKILVFGGARSTDRGPATNTEEEDIHRTWWPEEIPSQQERDNALRNLAVHGNKVDYILTHDAPSCFYYRKGMVPNEVSNFLQQLWETIDFKMWYCGHHHIDEQYGKLQVLFNDVLELK